MKDEIYDPFKAGVDVQAKFVPDPRIFMTKARLDAIIESGEPVPPSEHALKAGTK